MPNSSGSCGSTGAPLAAARTRELGTVSSPRECRPRCGDDASSGSRALPRLSSTGRTGHAGWPQALRCGLRSTTGRRFHPPRSRSGRRGRTRAACSPRNSAIPSILTGISRRFRAMAAEAGLPVTEFHAALHTTATLELQWKGRREDRFPDPGQLDYPGHRGPVSPCLGPDADRRGQDGGLALPPRKTRKAAE